MTCGIIGGYGATGFVVATSLRNSGDHDILIGGRDLAAATAAATKLGGRTSAVQVDILDSVSLDAFCSRCSIIVNCAGPAMLLQVRVAQAALRARGHYIDVAGMSFVKEGMSSHSQQIADLGLSFVVSAGWTPGLTELLPASAYAQARKQMDTIESLKVYFSDCGDWSDNALRDGAWYLHKTGMPTPGYFRKGQWVRAKVSEASLKVDLGDPLGLGRFSLFSMPELNEMGRQLTDCDFFTYSYLSGVSNALAAMTIALLPLPDSLGVRMLRNMFRRNRLPVGGFVVAHVAGHVQGQKLTLASQLTFPKNRDYWINGLVPATVARMIAAGQNVERGVHFLSAAVDPIAFRQSRRSRESSRPIRFCDNMQAMRNWGLSLCIMSSLAFAADENILAKLKPIGPVSTYTKTADAVTLTCADGSQVRLTILAPDLVRVRAAFAKALPEHDHSWAVAKTSWDAPRFSVSEAGDSITVSTSELDVVVHRSPLRIEFRDTRTQRTILADAGPMLYDPHGSTIAATKKFGFDEHFYGLGEKAARLDKRRGQFSMWSSDTPGYRLGRDPIYQSIPFYIGLDAAKGSTSAYGVFFDNSYRTHFDFGATSQEYISFSSEGGEMNYYFFWGPQITKVVGRYTDLTGRMPMPPIWALGNQQSRYSYYPDSLAEEVVRRYRQDDLPLDVLHLDIHYMDGYRIFTWNPQRFPDPAKFVGRLKDLGVKVVTIVDPGVKYQPAKAGEKPYPVYDEGARNNYFLKRADGSLYIGEVWPGLSVFVDYTLPAAARWWGDLFRAYTSVGVAGIWTDMNEPADFIDQKGESQWNVVSDDDGQHSLNAKNRNVFALGMARATYEGLRRVRPGERPFVITRSGYAGIQRYSTMWTGDNDSTWESLSLTIPMFQTLGLSGEPFAGGDIGGFMGNGNAELLTRWYESAFLTPFCRNHKDIHGYDHEPWRFGPAYEDIIRKYLKLRYRLMPFLYTQIEDAHRTGLPVFRPLLLNDQDDLNTLNLDDEFMIGRDLLIAPVLRPDLEKRRVYLPAGTWVDYWTGKRYAGRRFIVADAPLETVPLFVRAGAILPMGPDRNFIDEQPALPITYDVFPDESGKAATTLYEDDGHTENYLQGAFRRTNIEMSGNEIHVSKPEGSYATGRRPLTFQLPRETAPDRVTVDGKPLAHIKPEAAGAGWYLANHHLVVRMENDSTAHVIRVAP